MLAALPSVALADPAPYPTNAATAHAIDELANAIAQGRLTRTPTPTPTSTPRSTNTPVPGATTTSTDTPSPTNTPMPAACWLTDQNLGDPDNGYIVFDQNGAPVACPVDQAVDVTPQPTLEPTATLTLTPRPAAPRPAVVSAPQPAPSSQVRTVIQTVVVEVTAVPTDTLVVATSTATRTPTAMATRTPSPSPSSTSRPTPVAVLGVQATPIPITRSVMSTESRGTWSWAAFLGYLAAFIGTVVLVAAVLTRRRVVVWGTKAKKGGARA